MELTNREKRIIVAAFRHKNGSPFRFSEAGDAAGFDHEATQDLYKILIDKRLVQAGYMGEATFTAQGREIARGLIESGKHGPTQVVVLTKKQEDLLLEIVRVANSAGEVPRGGFIPAGYTRETIDAALMELKEIPLPERGRILQVMRNFIQLFDEGRKLAKEVLERRKEPEDPTYAGGHPGVPISLERLDVPPGTKLPIAEKSSMRGWAQWLYEIVKEGRKTPVGKLAYALLLLGSVAAFVGILFRFNFKYAFFSMVAIVPLAGVVLALSWASEHGKKDARPFYLVFLVICMLAFAAVVALSISITFFGVPEVGARRIFGS